MKCFHFLLTVGLLTVFTLSSCQKPASEINVENHKPPPAPDLTQNTLCETESESNPDLSTIAEIQGEFFPDIDHIIQLFKMEKNEVIAWLGDDYTIVPAGAESLLSGYEYEKYGITVVFEDEGGFRVLYCTDEVDISGARLGMTFAEIQGLLHNAEITRTTPLDRSPPLILKHNVEELWVVFGAFEESGVSETLHIVRNRLLD